jgi:hypothetical protein
MEKEFRTVLLMGAALASLLVTACTDDSPGNGAQPAATFRFRMDNDAAGVKDFIATTSDAALIARVRGQLQLPEGSRNLHVNGAIVAAAAGDNLAWGWRFRNDDWDLAETSIELCDGNAQLVQQDLAYWLNTVGRFCPWGARVAGELVKDSGATGIIVRFNSPPSPAVLQQRVQLMQQIADERGLVLTYGSEGALGAHRLDLEWVMGMDHAEGLARAITTQVPDIDYAEPDARMVPAAAP